MTNEREEIGRERKRKNMRRKEEKRQIKSKTIAFIKSVSGQ